MVAAFKHNGRWPTAADQALRHGGEVWCVNGHFALRVFAVRVKAHGQHHGLRCELVGGDQRLIKRLEEGGRIAAMRQWNVQVEARSNTFAYFAGVTRYNGVKIEWVSVDADVENVVAVVKNLLNALSVVHINV